MAIDIKRYRNVFFLKRQWIIIVVQLSIAVFNLENIILQVVVVERFHSITPSLPVRHWETRSFIAGSKLSSLL